MGKDRMDRRDFLNRLGLTGLALGLGATGCGEGREQAQAGSGAKAPLGLLDSGPKVGLCTIAFQDRPFYEVLELAAGVGFHGVEPWGKPDHLPLTRTDDEVKAVRDKIAELGMETSHYGCYVWLGDGQKPEDKDKDMDRAIQITRLLGTNICRIWAGTKNSELLSEDEWKLMVDDGKRFCAKAEDTGILLAMEMHSNSVTNKAAAMVELIERVGSPALKANYQILNSSEDPYERARVAGPHVVMVHAQNDSAGRGQPLICEGTVDFQKIYDILKPFGFKGYFEVEFVRGKTYEEKVEALKADCACLKGIS